MLNRLFVKTSLSQIGFLRKQRRDQIELERAPHPI